MVEEGPLGLERLLAVLARVAEAAAAVELLQVHPQAHLARELLVALVAPVGLEVKCVRKSENFPCNDSNLH